MPKGLTGLQGCRNWVKRQLESEQVLVSFTGSWDLCKPASHVPFVALSAVVILCVYLCVSLPPKHMTRCYLPTAGKTPPRGLDGVRLRRERGRREQEEKLPKDPAGPTSCLHGHRGGGADKRG